MQHIKVLWWFIIYELHFHSACDPLKCIKYDSVAFPMYTLLTPFLKTHLLAYHDDSSWLLRCAHTHDGCHTNSGSLEIHPTENENTVVTTLLKYAPMHVFTLLSLKAPLRISDH